LETVEAQVEHLGHLFDGQRALGQQSDDFQPVGVG